MHFEPPFENMMRRRRYKGGWDMLFGIDLCRRRTVRRKRSGGIPLRAAAVLLSAVIVTALLFLAPQWLLVLLVIALTGAVIALICAH